MATGIGQVIEWFDWTLYASFAPFFADRFFPAGGSAFTGLLAAFGVYAIGFFFRPLGGVVFGHLADRFGRGVIFNLTVLMMAAGSLVIAVLPTYGQVGIAAPLLLLVARIVQGLSAGGEMPASTALVTEAVPARRRAFYSSSIFVGTGIGVLLASLLGWVLTSALSETEMSSYGWRIAFGAGALMGLYGLAMRRSLHLPTQPTQDQAAQERTVPGQYGPRQGTPARDGHEGTARDFATLFRTEPGGVLRIIGFGIACTVGFYTLTVYMPTYLRLDAGMPSSTAFMVNCVVLTVYSVLPPLTGRMSDRWGRRPVMGWSSLALAVLLVPLVSAMSDSVAVTLPCMLAAIILLTGCHGPLPAVMSEQFSPRLRGLGVGVAYSLVTAVFGGTATYLAAWLSGLGHPLWFFGYVATTFALAAVCLFTMPETAERKLGGGPAAT